MGFSLETALRFRVTGRVQGIGFRAFIQRTGQQFGLTGWVKNNADGSVSGIAEGDHGLLIEFIKTVRIGNRWSSVEACEELAQKFTGEFQSFGIRP